MTDDGWEMVGEKKKDTGGRGGGGRGGQGGRNNNNNRGSNRGDRSQGGRGNNNRGGNGGRNNNNNRRDNNNNNNRGKGGDRGNNNNNKESNKDKEERSAPPAQQDAARQPEPAAEPAPASSAPAADAGEAKTERGENEEPRTVFSDPQEYDIKHPLQNTWILWYDNPGRKISQEAWGQQLHNIRAMNTVEDFWCTFNNVQSPSQLISGSNYHLFKEGIQPAWEDPKNQHGGKWVVTIPRQRKAEVDNYWLNAVLTCIGEGFTDSDAVCGVVVSLRKASDRIALWTANAADEEECLKVGRNLRKALQLEEKINLGYQAHADAMKRNSSFNNKTRYEC